MLLRIQAPRGLLHKPPLSLPSGTTFTTSSQSLSGLLPSSEAGLTSTFSTQLYDNSIAAFFPKVKPSSFQAHFESEDAFASFNTVITAACSRFSKSVAVSSALIASSTSPTLNSAQINADSAKFLLDPLGTINSFAAAHSNSRVNARFYPTRLSTYSPKSISYDRLQNLLSNLRPTFYPVYQVCRVPSTAS
jgi:hypothetical protein